MFAWCVSVSTAAVSHLCCPLLSHSEYLSMQLITYTWPLKVKVLGSQPAGDVSHKPSSRLPLLSTRPAVTLATRKRAATNVAAWWTEAWCVWTVCLRLLPDSVVAAIWTRALLCLSPAWPLCILNTLQHHQSRIKPWKSLTWKSEKNRWSLDSYSGVLHQICLRTDKQTCSSQYSVLLRRAE